MKLGVIPGLLIILLFKSPDAWNQNPFANILLEFYGWGPRTNVNWISSLSDSDRLEIHLTFGFRCWRLKWFKWTTDFKKAAHEVNGTWSRVISTRSWDYIVCKPWRPLGGLLGRCRANHTLEESMGKWFFTLLRFLKKLLSHPSINAPKQISTEFLACQTLTG